MRAAAVLLLFAGIASGDAHSSGFFTRHSVRLHYLDWGGSGDPLVLLAGLGNTAHVFDEFAPRLTDRFRVVALTRRGFGESGRPDTGYDTTSLGEDVVALLDHLELERASFAGHSIAGTELSWLGAHRAERVRRLIYLDAYCYGCKGAPALGGLGVTPPPLTDEIRGSPERRRIYEQRYRGVVLPDHEYVHAAKPGAAAVNAIRTNVIQPALQRISSPVLLFFADARDVSDQYRWVDEMAEGDRAKAQMAFADNVVNRTAHRTIIGEAMPRAKTVMVPRGHHYVFISHPELVEREMRAFLTRD